MRNRLRKSILVLFTLALLASIPSGPGSIAQESPDEPSSSLEAASASYARLDELLAMGNTRQLMSIGGIEELHPTFDEYLERGELRMALYSDCAGAVDDANLALGINPDAAPATLLHARAKIGLRDYTAAVADYDLLLTQSPDDPSLLRSKALAYFWDEDYVNALVEVRKLAGDQEYDPPVYPHRENILLLARCERGLGQTANSIHDYSRVVSDSRTPLVVYVELAEYEAELGNLTNARNTYLSAFGRITTKRGQQGVGPEQAALSFPPEWRLRMGQLGKHGSVPGWQNDLVETIRTVDAQQAVTKPSAVLYALRSMAAVELGYDMRARSDAIKAWKIHYNTANGQDPPAPYSETCVILRTILGDNHLVFRSPSTVCPPPTPTPTPTP